MGLTPGSRLGAYEIVGLIGAGGMGEVYRARDSRLDRQVAIKALPDGPRANLERAARFEREAKLLATLNHPNIATIHGLEHVGGDQFIVMELVEGPTLADRITEGAIPVPEALQIAKQIAEALEAAHEAGVIHRDLKPANVKVRPDGTVKVLDFGLAKAMAGDPLTSPALANSPTITSPVGVTGVGMLIGTAAYMSPEQAKGKAADKRSDLWAFGCVLFEMLTGRPPFGGEDVSDTLAFVLTKEPDWYALPADTPPPVGTLLRRCLEKDRRKRVGDISTASFVIDEARVSGTAAYDSSPSLPLRSGSLWRRLTIYTAPALIAGLAMAGGVWFAVRPVPPRVSRLAITMTPTTALTINGVDRDVAITPDGSRVIYVGNGGRELFVRPLDALEPTSLFTGAPRAPFVSPDGQWVGFIDLQSVLKKVALTGGPPSTIATIDGVSRGATWTLDDMIVFATNSTTTGLQQVSPEGGPVTVITRPDRANGEFDHVWPEQLPDGRTLLFTIVPFTGRLDAAQVVAVDRKTGTQRVLVRGGSHAHYVRSGHLIYGAADTLRAVVFDPIALETRGTSHLVASEVATTGTAGRGVDAVVASDGTLAYVRGIGSGGPRNLVWVDREGRETPIAAEPRPYMYPRISPDGGQVVASILDGGGDLWSWDFARVQLNSRTFAPGQDLYPLWTPNGQGLIFASERDGTFNLYSQAADGTGAERLTSGTNVQFPTAISPDGTKVIFTETTSATTEDVMQMELTGTHTVTPLVQTPAVERNGIVSPDGRWLAYETNDRGQLEIYVRPYPDVNRAFWQVSTGGGTRPLWSRTSQELFYVSLAGAIMRVGVPPSASWATASTPTPLVKNGLMIALTGFVGRTYDISPDGGRFLVVKAATESNTQPPQLVVVQHFDEELKRLVPSN